jgi:H+/Cl- antiporter ClcA
VSVPSATIDRVTPAAAPLRTLLARLVDIGRNLAEQVALGIVAGVPAGLASFVFLRLLDTVIDFREDEAPWLVYLLPFAGFAIVAFYHHLGGRAVRGSNLVIEEVHEPIDTNPLDTGQPDADARADGSGSGDVNGESNGNGVPARLAPMVMTAATAGHLFGAAVGREGAAIQMSASIADTIARTFGLRGRLRRELLVAAIAAGFGSLFGMPIAGAVFALEVQAVGRVRFEAVLASITGALVGARVVTALGVEHPFTPRLDLDVDVWMAARLAAAGLAFGLCASLFVWMTHAVKDVLAPVAYPPIRGAIVGVVVVLATFVVGRDYLSLSLPLADAALAGASVATFAFLGKIFFTAVCLGGGLPGGEVAPLFVVGSTLGSTLAGPLDIPRPVLAGVGFVSVLAGAANTPIACTILAVELFGGGLLIPAAITCAVAFVSSSHVGIYPAQMVAIRKHAHHR